MSLTLAEVEHIARLARLELSEEEKIRFREQLSAILDYAARLQEVDTRNISPTAWTVNVQAPLREDVPAQGLPTSEVLSNAPQVQDNQFRVPPVLEG
ncbi:MULTISPECIES: Asp-tRNA(Asn)/Glu-tRNA(Gln) amidotransferase subunit GatC [Anaerolinea]|jgi:aspartyl-tRNA(Asn)/glutamyl-tRNA(Gln) amidotransferase subunit C|uniref:Asp-tRNA(Asn)/Glu-tRNA(Gln) amidotransferase subunit GatC n=1 Tax=Anaerolinea TaxID=233189 RepID=UPI00262B0E38|nr:Asp-tRNA(Asn)/Glu-tRNA(Gln) amidotransferase subunit GatC [Anaerolinea thermophila]